MENLDLNKKIEYHTSNWKIEGARDRSEIWKELSEKMNNSTKTKVSKFNFKPIIGIAATICLLIASAFLFYSYNNVEIKSYQSEIKNIDLPDGSKVFLNSMSKLSYNKLTWKKNRKLKLEGEAFFEVKRGENFIVDCKSGDIEVLGTSFNVNTRNEKLKVFCETGRVKVENNIKEDVIIKAGQSAVVYKNNTIDLSDKFNSKYLNWKNGEFHFSDESLGIVLDEFERQFGKVIQIEDEIRQRKFTGVFYNDNINEALIMLCTPMSLTFEISEDQVKIKSKY